MAKKKKKSEAAEHLIESLMDDLKGLSSEASYHDNVYGGKSHSDDFNRYNSARQDEGEYSSNGPEAEYTSSRSEDEYSSGDGESDLVQSSESNDLWNNFANNIKGGDVSSNEVLDGLYTEEPLASLEGSYDSGSDFELPVIAEDVVSAFQGPSVGDYNQSPSQIINIASSNDDPTVALQNFKGQEQKNDEKTFQIHSDVDLKEEPANPTNFTSAETVAVSGFANAAKKQKKSAPAARVSVGTPKAPEMRFGGNVLTSVDASLAQAESLKIAQQRILELEKENEVLRAENDELASAGEIVRSRTDEMAIQINKVEREKQDVLESSQNELLILKGNLQYKTNELVVQRQKIEDLETRLKSDFKKIRVRERELENRLEIIRAEKAALIQSKDEYILEQKRKIDQLSQELDNYRKKCLELNKQIETNQDQVRRTERALRLALTNLESKEENLVPLKKAD